MKELSLNVLDIVQNSLSAGAEHITVAISEDPAADLTRITIGDDGRGMDEEMVARVTDPFTTTRTTRSIGLGIPLLKMAAEMVGGSFNIKSKPGVGTEVTAEFVLSHIDMPPIGDMAGTLVTVLQGNPEINLVYKRSIADHTFIFDTDEIREAIGDIPIDTPEILSWISEYIAEGEAGPPQP